MPSADIPKEFITPTRDKVVEDAGNSWLVRSMQVDSTKAVDVGPGTFPGIATQVAADLVMPIYANSVTIVKSWVVRNTFGDRLLKLAAEKIGEEDGALRPAVGAAGYFEATKIADGGALFDSEVTLVHQPTGLRFRANADATYLDGDPIPLIGIDTGPETNLDADAVLTFESPPPGVSLTARVLAQNDGTGALVGLTGGAVAETEQELQERIIAAQTNPKAAGNNAQIVATAQKTASVPVEKAFAIPAWMGGGATSVPFTLRPDAVASRIPNGVQRALVEADLRSTFAADWTITVPTILAQALTIAIGVTWLSSARGWTDLVQWPPYVPGDAVQASVVTSSLAMRLITNSTDIAAPAVGQTIGFFDLPTKSFKRKRIATVAVVIANRAWDVTFSSALGVSDNFLPTVHALVSPWSPSLGRLPASMIAYARSLGPGEQFASLPDPGGRRRRWPFSPDEWPSVVTNEGLVTAAKASGAISDVEPLLPATPHATTVGTPGVANYLQELTDFAVFPQT